jgi:hypothetical protein
VGVHGWRRQFLGHVSWGDLLGGQSWVGSWAVPNPSLPVARLPLLKWGPTHQPVYQPENVPLYALNTRLHHWYIFGELLCEKERWLAFPDGYQVVEVRFGDHAQLVVWRYFRSLAH